MFSYIYMEARNGAKPYTIVGDNEKNIANQAVDHIRDLVCNFGTAIEQDKMFKMLAVLSAPDAIKAYEEYSSIHSGPSIIYHKITPCEITV